MPLAQHSPYDLVVAGGGPAGATLATLVAMRGFRVLLLEREHFPRYQIGESLLPVTVHGICGLLGVAAELAASDFTIKHGGTFRWGKNPEPWTFYFRDLPAFAHGKSYAYQVERMRFDSMLLDNARRAGVEVREGCQVVRTLAVAGRVEGVEYLDESKAVRSAAARFFADASGSRGRTYREMTGQRHHSDFFRNVALFGYFENGTRLPEPNSGNILSVAFDDGWFWYIPLTATLTSVGAVVRSEMAARVRGDPDRALSALIAACPLISQYLSGATRVTDGPYGQIRVRRDYSYCHDRFHRSGMVLVGDSACFVDPVLSSGVHLATYGALLAARAVNSSLAATVPEDDGFAEFERRYRAEFTFFYRFLRTFYAKNASERSYFWEAKRITGSALSDVVAFLELVGGAASREPALVAYDEPLYSYADRSAAAPSLAAPRTAGLIPSDDGLAWQWAADAGRPACSR